MLQGMLMVPGNQVRKSGYLFEYDESHMTRYDARKGSRSAGQATPCRKVGRRRREPKGHISAIWIFASHPVRTPSGSIDGLRLRRLLNPGQSSSLRVMAYRFGATCSHLDAQIHSTSLKSPALNS